MSAPRTRLAKWLILGCLATVGILLVLLLRADTGLQPAEKQSGWPTKERPQPLSVATESVRLPVKVGLEAVVATSDNQGVARILALDDNLRPVPAVEMDMRRVPGNYAESQGLMVQLNSAICPSASTWSMLGMRCWCTPIVVDLRCC